MVYSIASSSSSSNWCVPTRRELIFETSEVNDLDGFHIEDFCTELELSDIEINESTSKKIATFIRMHQEIKVFALQSIYFRRGDTLDVQSENLARIINAFDLSSSKISDLCLQFPFFYRQATVGHAIASLIKNSRTLNKIEISSFGTMHSDVVIRFEPFIEILNAIAVNGSFTSVILNLDFSPEDSSLEQVNNASKVLAEAFCKNIKLEIFLISGFLRLLDADLKAIGKNIQNHPYLRELELSFSDDVADLDDTSEWEHVEGAQAVIQGATNHPSLEVLMMNSYFAEIKGEAKLDLVNLLRLNHSIRILSLAETSLDEESFMILFHALADHRSPLELIDISGWDNSVVWHKSKQLQAENNLNELNDPNFRAITIEQSTKKLEQVLRTSMIANYWFKTTIHGFQPCVEGGSLDLSKDKIDRKRKMRISLTELLLGELDHPPTRLPQIRLI